MRDIANAVGAVQVLAPVVLAATNTSAAIDLMGFDAAAVIINTGAIAGAGDFTAKLQESDTTTGGDFTDVAGTDLVRAFPASLAADSVVKVGYIGNKRYLRLVTTKNGGTSIAASAVMIKGRATSRPVA